MDIVRLILVAAKPSSSVTTVLFNLVSRILAVFYHRDDHDRRRPI
jgi:hypothetical protein